MRIINKLLKVGLALALLGVLSVALLYAYFKNELPTEAELRDVRLQTPMQIYSQEGLLISQYGEKKRIPLTLDQMPEHMIDAVLDTEDSRFYSHNGIDFIGLTRAVFKMLTSSKRKQGASTITMQLARNMHLTRDRTITRKIKEVFVALHIESLFTKNEILELYLNKIELGHRAFGVGAAAQVYYGKDINELTLAQIATIAGLPKAPSTLNPISRPERSKNRRAVVLGRMLAMGSISKVDYLNAKNAPVTAKRHGVDIKAPAPYVAAMVNQWMLEQSDLEDVYTNGYKVYTTIPWNLQKAAQDAVVNNLHKYDERHGYRTKKVPYLWEEPEPQESQDAPTAQTQPAQNQSHNQTQGLIATANASESPAWDKEKIHEHLKKINRYGDLIPAVVTAIGEQDAKVQLKDGNVVNLDWQNLKWAKPYINDSKHGRSPKTTSDIFKPGARIWVRQQANGLYRLAQLPGPSGALVAIDPQNGALRSIVGGYSYYLSQYNRATQAKRQVGSTIKPFIYSAALDNGHTLASLIMDAPIHQWDEELGVAWRPRNSPPIYDGPTRIRVALAKSKNVVSVRLLKGIGLKNTVDHITKFGIPADELPLNDSLALGSASLAPLQVAAATSTFANGGFLIEPYIVERVVNADERVVYQANPMVVCKSCEEQNNNRNNRIDNNSDDSEQYPEQLIPAPRVIDEQNAFLISQAMTSTIWGGGNWRHKTGWNGTGWRATRKLKRRDLSGKTGTTNDAKDTWFSGFSNKLMVTTWVGFDNPSRALGRSGIGSESGAITAQPAWNDYMVVAMKDIEEQTLQIPEKIISVRIDEKTGLLATKNDHTSRFEYFISGTEPEKYATSDQTPEVIDNDGQGKVTDEEEIF